MKCFVIGSYDYQIFVDAKRIIMLNDYREKGEIVDLSLKAPLVFRS